MQCGYYTHVTVQAEQCDLKRHVVVLSYQESQAVLWKQ